MWKLPCSVGIVLYCFFVHQIIALNKLLKMVLIVSKKLFFHSQDIHFFVFPSFTLFPGSHCKKRWPKMNHKVSKTTDWLNKNWKTHYLISWEGKKVWYWNLILKIVMGKACRKYAPKVSPKPLLILINRSRQTVQASNSFDENKIFWKRIMKKG